MLHTYKAILRGNQLEWEGDIPENISNEQPLEVYVTVLEDMVKPPKEVQGQRMAAILEQIAALQPLPGIPDPAAWEREIRQDRERLT